MLLAAPSPASLEVVNDLNGFIANFWRATVAQPEAVAKAADYPVSHIDIGARHRWLMEQRERIGAALQDPLWPGDARAAGWWLWGQCCWIGAGWCEYDGKIPSASNAGKIPIIGNAGVGVQALGQVPHASNAGRGVQALGKIPHVSDAGMGDGMLTSGGSTALRWLSQLAARLERVRVIHGTWDRCLNNHYGGADTAVFLDPPYDGYEALYRTGAIAQAVAAWCREHGADMRVAICGHRGDYELPGWTVVEWERKRMTYAGAATKANEAIWFSPVCLSPKRSTQALMFAASEAAS